MVYLGGNIGHKGNKVDLLVMEAVALSWKSGSVSTMSTHQSISRIKEQDLLIQELKEKTDGLQKMVEDKHIFMGKTREEKKKNWVT